MNECQYCKDEIEESNTYTVTSPDKRELSICEGCMSEISTFFGEKKSEEIQLNQEGGAATLKLIEHERPIVLGEVVGGKTRVFKNAVISNIERTREALREDIYARYGAQRELVVKRVTIDLYDTIEDAKEFSLRRRGADMWAEKSGIFFGGVSGAWKPGSLISG